MSTLQGGCLPPALRAPPEDIYGKMIGIAGGSFQLETDGMDWTQQIDGYCERLSPALWAELVNAVTNLAFVVAAVLMWHRGSGVASARVLAGMLMLIGIGSFLFHTHATVWAALADVVPIAAFVLTYLYLVNRWVLRRERVAAILLTAVFIPFAAIVTLGVSEIPFLRISGSYWAVPLALVVYGIGLRRRFPELVRGFWIGAAILVLSICLRSLDMTVCSGFPVGTHFAWHLLNGVMLGWMIHVWVRFVKARRLAGQGWAR